jgi:serine/threonine protein kinase
MTGPSEPSARRSPDPENIVGYAVAGRYVIRRCVSQGGMGVVYLARQEPLGREVIVKVVRTDTADAEAEARFRREARSLSLLSHPNVVQIYDYGFDADTSLYFIVMEYVPGITLARYRRRRTILPVDELLPIASQMLEGVAEAHRAGLIHRDLKPSNVVLTSPDGRRLGVKLLDFGLSKFAEGDEPVTRANTFAGSAMYMAPEFMRAPQTADARADVYSLGVLFYQLLSGANPVQGDTPYQVLHQQVTGNVRPLRDSLPDGTQIPPALIHLVDRCLSLSPDDRPADGKALLDELTAALVSVVPNPTEAALAAATAQEAEHNPEPSTLRSRTGPMSLRPDSATGSMPSPSPPRGTRTIVWFVAAAVAVSGMSAVVFLAVLLALLLVGDPYRPPGPGPAAVTDGITATVLREGALRALRDGDYERAVALTTEAVSVSPGDPDLMDLLTIVTDLRDRQGAPSEAAVRAPELEPAPDARALDRPGPSLPSAPAPAVEVGTAVVITQPTGMTFEIPGVFRGQTPARTDVPVGSHEVLFYLDGEVVHAARLDVPRDGVELVEVDIERPPPDAAIAVPRFVGRPVVYVFVPSTIKPRVLQDSLSESLPGMTVSAFGTFGEFKRALSTAPPTAVLAPRGVLDALALPAHLQGRDESGATTQRYVLVSPQAVVPDELGGAVIGTVDVTGRESSAEVVAALLGTSGRPQVKRVAEESDLLALLQFGGADALLLTEGAARRLMSTTQMSLVVTDLGSGAGLPALSVLDAAARDQLQSAIRSLGTEPNARIGVNGWQGQ